MLLILKDLEKHLRSFILSLPDLLARRLFGGIGQSREKSWIIRSSVLRIDGRIMTTIGTEFAMNLWINTADG
jgi:hypothetical protein